MSTWKVALGTLVEKTLVTQVVADCDRFSLVYAGLNWFVLVRVSDDTDSARQGIVGNSSLFNGPLEQGG